MSRYICHYCKEEHGTENMVAYCAVCFAAKDETIRRLQEELIVSKAAGPHGWKKVREDRYVELYKKAIDETAILECRLKAAEKVIEAVRRKSARGLDYYCKIDDALDQYDAESAK